MHEPEAVLAYESHTGKSDFGTRDVAAPVATVDDKDPVPSSSTVLRPLEEGGGITTAVCGAGLSLPVILPSGVASSPSSSSSSRRIGSSKVPAACFTWTRSVSERVLLAEGPVLVGHTILAE